MFKGRRGSPGPPVGGGVSGVGGGLGKACHGSDIGVESDRGDLLREVDLGLGNARGLLQRLLDRRGTQLAGHVLHVQGVDLEFGKRRYNLFLQ